MNPVSKSALVFNSNELGLGAKPIELACNNASVSNLPSSFGSSQDSP